jgi:hypothetical protein
MKRVEYYFLGTRVTYEGPADFFSDSSLTTFALSIRDEYLAHVYSYRGLFPALQVNGKKINSYFLSDFGCRRSELVDSFSEYVNRRYIEKGILDGKIFDVEFSVPTNRGRRLSLLIYLAKQALFLLLMVVKVYIIKLFSHLPSYDSILSCREFYLVRHPKHLNPSGMDGKYGKLPSNSLFINTIISDGLHQKISILGLLKYLFSKKAPHDKSIILEGFFSVRDVPEFFRLVFIYVKFLIRIRRETFLIGGVNLTNYWYEEFLNSALRIPRLLVHKGSVNRLSEYIGNITTTVNYFLHEYPYGRTFLFLFRCSLNNATAFTGWQHGPSGELKLVYHVSPNELRQNADGYDSWTTPDAVLAEDGESAEIYARNGYINISVMKDIPRLRYHDSSAVFGIVQESSCTFLIFGLNDHEDWIRWILLNRDTVLKAYIPWYVKVHPRSNVFSITKRLNSLNIPFTSLNVREVLSSAKCIIYTYSSLGIEAKARGIHTRQIIVNGRINES